MPWVVTPFGGKEAEAYRGGVGWDGTVCQGRMACQHQAKVGLEARGQRAARGRGQVPGADGEGDGVLWEGQPQRLLRRQ